MKFDEISKDVLEAAAQEYRIHGWKGVIEKWPWMKEPREAYLSYAREVSKIAGIPDSKDIPKNEIEMLGKQLIVSIGNRGSSKQMPARNKNTSKQDGSRSLITLYERCIEQYSYAPCDGIVAILAGIALTKRIEECRARLSEKYEFEQSADGSWRATVKSTPEEIELNKLKAQILDLEARIVANKNGQNK